MIRQSVEQPNEIADFHPISNGISDFAVNGIASQIISFYCDRFLRQISWHESVLGVAVLARDALLFDRVFHADTPEGRLLASEVVPSGEMDQAILFTVEIRIRDNGTGIPAEVREKMFNPFFTTKPAGEGTGLGLSMTHDIIVKQHGGKIDVDTEPGMFTEFVITLPRTTAPQKTAGGTN